MNNLDAKYFVVNEDSKEGPFSISELKQQPLLRTTLVWTKGMKTWVLAGDMEELEELFLNVPPPIPTLAVTQKGSQRNISSQTREESAKVTFAREIKIVGKILLIALLIGAVSYPFHFGMVDGFADWNAKRKWEAWSDNWGSEESSIMFMDARAKSAALGYTGDATYVKRYHEERIAQAARIAVSPSENTAIWAFLIILATRYLLKAIRWVKETSATTA